MSLQAQCSQCGTLSPEIPEGTPPDTMLFGVWGWGLDLSQVEEERLAMAEGRQIQPRPNLLCDACRRGREVQAGSRIVRVSA